MRSSPPVTPDVPVALLELAGRRLRPLSGDWGWAGARPGEPVGHWLRLIHPLDRPAVERGLAEAAELSDADIRRLPVRLSDFGWVEAEWRVARRSPGGRATHLRVTLRFPAGGPEPASPADWSPPAPPEAESGAATFTWTEGSPGTPALGVSPALAVWLGETPTTPGALLAHLDAESAWALREHLSGPDAAGPLERVAELRCGTGGGRPVRLSVTPPTQIGGARVAFGVLRDVGEALRLREALAERERLLGEAQALARLGSWRLDLREETLTGSDGLLDLLGRPAGPPSLATWLDRTHPEDRDRVRAALTGPWAGEGLLLHHRLLRPGGEERVIEVRGRAEAGPDGQPTLRYGTAQDVTGQARAETRERETRRLQAALLDAAVSVTATLDHEEVLSRLIASVERIVPFDEADVLLLGPDGDTLSVVLRRLGPGAPAGVGREARPLSLSGLPLLGRAAAHGALTVRDVRSSPEWVRLPEGTWIRSLLVYPIHVEGRLLGFLKLASRVPGAFPADRAESVRLFLGYVGAALHNSQLYGAARREARRARVLADLAAELSGPLDPAQVAEVIVRRTRAALGRGCVSLTREDPASGELCRVARAGFEDHPGAASAAVRDRPPLPPLPVLPLGPGVGTHAVLMTGADPEAAPVLAGMGYRQALRVSLVRGGKFLACLNVGLTDPAPLSADEQELISGVAEQAALALLTADLRAENAARVRDLTALNLTAQRLAQLLDAGALADALVDAVAGHFGAACAWVAIPTPEGRLEPLSTRPQPWPELGPGWPGAHPALAALPPDGPVALHPDACPAWWAALAERGLRSAALVPVPGEQPAVLLLASTSPGAFPPQRLDVLSTLAHHLGTALRNARLFRETRERLARLEALHDLDTIIGSAQDLDHVMGRVVEIAAAQPGVGAVAVCLRDCHAPGLKYVAARGTGDALPGLVPLTGGGVPALVALEGQPWRADDVAGSTLLGLGAWARRLGARGYQALPLLAQGQVLGVIEYVWHGEEPDPQTHVFLRVLADQAALAAGNARLHRDLQRQTTSLARAYDETLEGWSRALDLRDRETEGHTRRVTDLTLRLARAFGVDPEDLVHVRRGALLHDIGKMGIPDAILHKPGPLDAGEWEVMRRHPALALELLSPIGFLRPALDIPYSHHEKWDGTGYPRGLRGEAIPLPARLFAVVDVWDALTNDRPYRPAWTREQALAHIRAGSGTHFDPRVVEAFTALIVGQHPELAETVGES